MKKKLLFVLLCILLLPFMVNAKTEDEVSIKSVELVEKTGGAEEVEAPVIVDKTIRLSTSVSDVGDSITYKIVIKNDSSENFELDKKSFDLSSDYIKYTSSFQEDSNVVKANSLKEVYLKIEYKKEVPEELLTNGDYVDSQTIELAFDDGKGKSILNPKTGMSLISFIVLLITSIIVYKLSRKKSAKLMLLLIGATLLIPAGVYALTVLNIVIESKVSIGGSSVYVVSESGIMVGEAVPNDVNLRKTPAQAMADWANVTNSQGIQPIYLKYKLDNSNKVKENYLSFVITEEMASANPGMVAGTYTLKGEPGVVCPVIIDDGGGNGGEIVKSPTLVESTCEGDSPASYQSNISTIKKAFGYDSHPERCDSSRTDSFYCYINDFSYLVSVDKNGNIEVSYIINSYLHDCTIMNGVSSVCRVIEGAVIGPAPSDPIEPADPVGPVISK